MNSNPSFERRLLVIAVAVVAVAALAGPAAAVSIDTTDVPDSAETGSTLTVTVELADLYSGDAPRSWTLNVTTGLENASWETRTLDTAGDDIDVVEDAGNSTEHPVDADAGVTTVQVTLRGEVPDIEEFSYEPEERFHLATFELIRDGGGTDTLEEVTVHHYTADSADARSAIDEAQRAINDAQEAGGDTSTAESTLNNAIDAYNDGSHGLAVTLAGQSAEEADEAVAGATRTDLILFGAAAAIGVALLAGIIYWFRSGRQSHDKLG